MFLFENPSYFRLHIISRKYSVCGRHALQQPISIWLVCISADTHCSPAYVSNSLMTADKGVALCIYKLHLLPYNQLSIRTLFVTRHAQNKKKWNWFSRYFNIVLCTASLWLNLKHFNALFFCCWWWWQIRNGVCTVHKAETICKDNTIKLPKRRNIIFIFQPRECIFVRLVWEGTLLNG